MSLNGKRQGRGTTPGGEDGFTLLELVIVMTLFLVVIMIAANAFQKIVAVGGQQSASAESNIQGVVGLEIMRSDLERAGYGLPWPAPASTGLVFDFDESLVAANGLANGIDPKSFNDKALAVSIDPRKAPRPVQSAAAAGANAWENGRDYLVVKATSVGMNDAAKKWSFLEGTDATTSMKEWGNKDDFVPFDRLVTQQLVTQDSKPYRELVAADLTHFSYALPARSSGKYLAPAGYQATTSDTFVAYGVNSLADHSADPGELRMPYNRVDYYIARPADIPAHCAPGTGTLFKANLKHADGLATQYPLLECVADLQVIYALDTNGDGGVDLHGNEDLLAAMSAQSIREQLKEIRVYILAQEGKKDTSYTYPSQTVTVGGFGLGRTYDLATLNGIGNGWRNYRWKVYTIVVTPKNINN